MPHISRARKKLDPGKLTEARKQVLKEHWDGIVHNINKTRRVTEAEARKDLDKFKDKKTGYKPLGTFSYDEMVFCQLVYGKDIIKDPDFWRFWRKANGQEFLKFA